MENESEAKARRSNPKRTAMLIILVIVVLGLGFFAVKSGWLGMGGAGRTVATVNGAEIKEREVSARFNQLKEQGLINPQSEEQIQEVRTRLIDEIVNEELVIQHATEQGVQVTDEEAETAYGTIKGQYQSDEAFDADLKKIGLTQDELRKIMRRELVIQKFIEQYAAQQNLTASDAEIDQMYALLTQGQENPPKLADVRQNVEIEVKKQKLGQLMSALIQDLKQKADVKVL